MRAFVTTLTALLLVTGCVDQSKSPAVSDPKAAGPVCSAYGGFEEKVCATSIYSVIANPTTYYGRTIAFKGYVHKSSDGTIALYPSRYAAETSEIASAVLCTSAKVSCEDYVGKSTKVFGRFTDKTEPDFFFEPVGTIELAHVRSAKNVAER